MTKSCSECKFFDGCCCMYDYAAKAILNEERTASMCPNFSVGEYDEVALENSDYK